ncbi:glutamate racemase [Methylibium rhizosphaerae]|uniref:glutamate racemase n=1 Tax=Methylibium rhizosphaerae TaxID=2570323 RepID=UPI00112DE9F2|nr:glutamate racemase [Methylibium rhizosphaerae]
MPSEPPSESPPATHCIGVFDSGVGGLSVLRALRRALPSAQLLYVADSGFAPYGERDEAFVVDRSRRIARFLRAQGAQVLVIACNTATAAAVHLLRAEDPQWPVVGVEPGVKPAVAASRNGRIGVMATRGTLASDKFRRLIESHGMGATIVPQPCAGLARAIESGDLDAPPLLALIDDCCAPLREAQVDTVVLGCTHYPFASHHIQAALGPQVLLIDTAEAVARRTQSLCEQLPASGPAAASNLLWTTGNAEDLARIARRWLGFDCEVRPLAAASLGDG